MYDPGAAIYDAFYGARKDYAAEAAAVARIVRVRTPRARTLLDAGCGTGAHLAAFAGLGFDVRGFDASPKMLAIARSRLPDADLTLGDMTSLRVAERFDAVVSLFGAIAHVRTVDRLRDTLANFAAMLAPGGTIVVEGWIAPAEFEPGRQDLATIDTPDLKLARLSLARRLGPLAILDFNYLIGTRAGGVERAFERHECGLFDDADFEEACAAAGLSCERDRSDAVAFGRPLYVARAVR